MVSKEYILFLHDHRLGLRTEKRLKVRGDLIRRCKDKESEEAVKKVGKSSLKTNTLRSQRRESCKDGALRSNGAENTRIKC